MCRYYLRLYATRIALGVLPASVVKALNTIFGHVITKGGLHMAGTLDALALMMIGLARNGARTWDFVLNVHIG